MRRVSYVLAAVVLILLIAGRAGPLAAGPLEHYVGRSLAWIPFGATFVVTGRNGVIFEQLIGNPATVRLSGDRAALRMEVTEISSGLTVEAIAVLGPRSRSGESEQPGK